MDAQHGQQNGATSSKDNRVFKCGECPRAYSRVDHLTRHVRSHTKEKPYRCQICSKGFARRDLLKRHSAAHQRRLEENKEYGASGHDLISRVGRACRTCSEMHLRCDETKPCERCRKKNIECIFLDIELESKESAASSSTPTHAVDGTQTADVAAAEELMRLSDQQLYHMNQKPRPINQVTEYEYASQASAPLTSTQPHDAHSAFLGNSHNTQVPLDTDDNELFDTLGGWFPSVGMQDAWGNRSLLNFGGYEPAYILSDTDMGLLDTYNYNIPFDVQMLTPPEAIADPLLSESIKHTATVGHDAYRKTGIWLWRPSNSDTSIIDHHDLKLPAEVSKRRIAPLGSRKLEEKLDSLTREKMVGIIIDHCRNNNLPSLPPWDKWIASFPSVELLDALIQFALTAPLAECDVLFHLPTLSVRKARPELVMALVAFGAILTPDAAMRKLGMALQELIRQTLVYEWERQNQLTRDLHMAQAYHLVLVIGGWSGDSRKTELAEAFTGPAITMQRRANRFRRYNYPFPAVDSHDEGEILEQRWHAWLEAESWKRLVHHMAIGDAMQSLIFLTPPLIAYSEFVLPLPDAQDLWNATNASDWKVLYLARMAMSSDRSPSLHDCLVDSSHLSTHGHLLNDRFLAMGMIGHVWRKVWDYRQECSLFKNNRQPTDNHIARLNEVKSLVQNVRFVEDLTKPTNVVALLFLELSTMHLYMSLDDVQLFAGIEGSDEARLVYPDLVNWSHTQSSREAVWHAGQVLRIAKGCPPATLGAICALAVYHSALAFWTYGLMLKDPSHAEHDVQSRCSNYFWLDEHETIDKEAFIEHNVGQPVIRGLHDSNNPLSPPIAVLSQPVLVMDTIINVFKSNWNVPGVVSPVLVDNLINLLMGLRAAADKFVGG